MRKSPITEFELKKLKIVLSALEEYRSTGKISDLDSIRKQIEGFLQLPVSDPLVADILIHPYVLESYANVIIQSIRLENLGGEFFPKTEYALPLAEADSPTEAIRIRRFHSRDGRYYGIPFLADEGVYTFWNDEPIILTKITKAWQDELWLQTEMGWLSRPEVKLLSALSFSTPFVSGPRLCFQVSPRYYDVPTDVIVSESGKLDEVALKKAQILTRILDRIGSYDYLSWGFKSETVEIAPFQYLSEGISNERTDKLFNSLGLQDDLALRTSFLLLKSAMLWKYDGRIFGEDAMANMVFGLEGVLRLIHRRISGGKNFEIKPTFEHIESKFSKKPGYGWMLKFAYEQRVELAHPDPRNQTSWLPSIYAEDYMQGYGMATDLFYYAITGDVLPDTKW